MILFVDDMTHRFKNFQKAFPDKQEVVHVSDPEAACNALLRYDFSEVWLDHDAGEFMWDPGHQVPTFYLVAMFLVALKFKGQVYVHTGNPVGSDRIVNLLEAHSIAVSRPGAMTLFAIWGGTTP
jgi:hypothetical protein